MVVVTPNRSPIGIPISTSLIIHLQSASNQNHLLKKIIINRNFRNSPRDFAVRNDRLWNFGPKYITVMNMCTHLKDPGPFLPWSHYFWSGQSPTHWFWAFVWIVLVKASSRTSTFDSILASKFSALFSFLGYLLDFCKKNKAIIKKCNLTLKWAHLPLLGNF